MISKKKEINEVKNLPDFGDSSSSSEDNKKPILHHKKTDSLNRANLEINQEKDQKNVIKKYSN
jgi:hypothetical protein